MTIHIMRKLALSAMLGTCLVLLSISAQAAPKPITNAATTLVQGTGPSGQVFTGIFTPSSFSVANGALIATGTLTGSVLDVNGNSLGTISQTVSMLVSSINASCSILSLTLGPLHVNLLGLVIDLNQVVLTITAVPGAGNLLGNLLCSLANLLNGGTSFTLAQ